MMFEIHFRTIGYFLLIVASISTIKSLFEIFGLYEIFLPLRLRCFLEGFKSAGIVFVILFSIFEFDFVKEIFFGVYEFWKGLLNV